MAELATLKVSVKSIPNKVASAAVGMINEGKDIQLQVIGAGALNQAIKGVAVANDFLKENGEDFSLIVVPEFADLVIDGEERTGIRLVVEKR